jgi:hypothetical protein
MPRRAFDDDSFLYSEILAQHTSGVFPLNGSVKF